MPHPFERPLPCRRVEAGDALADEVDLFHLLEILADVHGVAHDLGLDAMMKKADQGESEKPAQTRQPLIPLAERFRFHAHPPKINHEETKGTKVCSDFSSCSSSLRG